MKKNFKVSDLIGPELDMAVAIAMGYVHCSGPWWHHKDDASRSLSIESFSPSMNCQQGHEVIEDNWIGLDRPKRGQTPPVWRALAEFKGDRLFNPMGNVVSVYGPTALIAAMRAKVGSVYGEFIEMKVPRKKRTD
jgi:hypothetical protein